METQQEEVTYGGGYEPARVDYHEPAAHYSEPKTERVAAGGDQYFATLEEAEAAARKLNEQYGVEHVPYDPKSYDGFQAGHTYADQSGYQASTYEHQEPRRQSYEPQRPVEPQHFEERPAVVESAPRRAS